MFSNGVENADAPDGNKDHAPYLMIWHQIKPRSEKSDAEPKDGIVEGH
jgi:hypothetical protein